MDWTHVLLIVIAILFGVIGYLLGAYRAYLTMAMEMLKVPTPSYNRLGRYRSPEFSEFSDKKYEITYDEQTYNVMALNEKSARQRFERDYRDLEGKYPVGEIIIKEVV